MYISLQITGWWFLKYFLCSPQKLGKSSNLTCAYVSDGLVQPPTSSCFCPPSVQVCFTPFVEVYSIYPSCCAVNCDNVFRMFSANDRCFSPGFLEYFFIHPAMWLGSFRGASGLKMVTVAIVWASKVGLQIETFEGWAGCASAWEQYVYILWYLNMLYILDWMFIRRHMYKTYMSHELYHYISGIYWGYPYLRIRCC